MNNKISFGAKFINTINVGKLEDKTNTYKQVNVSFVEVNPLNADDVSAINDIARYWENDKFALNISETAKAIFEDKNPENIKIYALTSQNDSFEKLDSNKILGVVEGEGTQPFNIHLNRLQARPEFVYELKPEYKGVGSAIQDSLKAIYNKISAIAEDEQSVKNHYIRNGYYEHPKGSKFFTWYKDYFADIFKIYR